MATRIVRVPLHEAAHRVELTIPPACFVGVQRTDGVFYIALEEEGDLIRFEARGDKLELHGPVDTLWYHVEEADAVVDGYAELLVSGSVNATVNGAA